MQPTFVLVGIFTLTQKPASMGQNCDCGFGFDVDSKFGFVAVSAWFAK